MNVSRELPQVDPVHAAIGSLAQRLIAVSSERISIHRAIGRVLAEPLLADRDSPALDVSAMDGYALRMSDLGNATLPVTATTPAGHPPAELLGGQAVRVFTGAPVPSGAQCVVRREDTEETASTVRLTVPVSSLQSGQNIRCRGENTRRGDVVLAAGRRIDASSIAALASFGTSEIGVRRKVRVAVLNTGDELAGPGEAVEDWQIRDSNGPTLEAWLSRLDWVEVIARERVEDSFESICDALRAQSACDAVILTGGVSMGDTDYVPAAIQEIGGDIVFHRLPIRPGRPVLGAVAGGKLLLGLPGNPVSVAVTSRVFGLPLLHALTGMGLITTRPLVQLASVDDMRLDLTWYRLVQIAPDGNVHLLATRGSGDLVSLAGSHGFVEVPPGQSSPGPWRLTLW